MLSAWKSTNSASINWTVTCMGLQHTSQSSIYACLETDASNSIEIGSQQYGQVKWCSNIAHNLKQKQPTMLLAVGLCFI